jgi:hypothetical protein
MPEADRQGLEKRALSPGREEQQGLKAFGRVAAFLESARRELTTGTRASTHMVFVTRSSAIHPERALLTP